jgi:YbbR domain-containing protein
MSPIRRFFLRNLGLKAFSLLLAFLLWNQVTSQDTVQGTVSAPVVFRNMPEGLEISSDPPGQVDVNLRTRRGEATIENATVVIDLRGREAGPSVVNLTEDNVQRTSGIDVLGISPALLKLELEATSSKRVKVAPQLSGEPAEGYRVVTLNSVPPDILVSGPSSAVQDVTMVATDLIDVAGRRESLTEEVFIELEDKRLRVGGEASVSVVVTIEEKRRAIAIAKVGVRVQPEGGSARLYTRTVRLSGTVPLSYTGNLQADLFEAVVNLTDYESQTDPYEIAPEIIVPEEYSGVFRLVRVTPETVRVRKSP